MKDLHQATDVGVLIGRFQVPELHAAHKELIDKVGGWHKKVLLVLGCTPSLGTRRNPLDFQARKLMINAHYPDLPVIPLMDQPDDTEWSKELDRRIREVFPVGTVTLYGGRDSFIPYYHGQFPCLEIEPTAYMAASGTMERKNASLEIRSSQDWRAGVVYAAFNRYPQAFPTVDVAVIRQVGDSGTEILLARKPEEKGYLLIGGFVDPSDENFEAAARREVMEEAHIEIGNPEYVGSFHIDDWRYRNEVDQIITTVFIAPYTFGAIQPDDDIEELRWFSLGEKFEFEHLVEHHRGLVRAVIDKVSRNGPTELMGRKIYELPASNR